MQGEGSEGEGRGEGGAGSGGSGAGGISLEDQELSRCGCCGIHGYGRGKG